MDDVLAELEWGGASDVLPGGPLRGARDGAEQPDGGVGAQLGGADRQRDGHEDGLVKLPLPGLHSDNLAHLVRAQYSAGYHSTEQ